MDKKKGIILISVLTLLIGLSSFVFIQTGKEKELDNGDTNINEGTKPEEDVVVITPEPSKPSTTVQPNASLQALIKAKEAVKKAEESLLQEDLDSAIELVKSTIKEEKYKNELLEELEKIQLVVSAKAEVDELATQIEEADSKEKIDEIRQTYDFDALIEQLEELEDSEHQNELIDRLEEILTILDDVTAPIIEGIDEDARTNENVTLTVDEEFTFVATLNGTEIELEDLEELDEEGEYLITLYDRAYNSASISFVIDKTAPIITGISEEEYSYSKDGLTPNTEDDDIKSVSLYKDEVEVPNYQLGTAIKELGEYVLTVTDELDQETEITFSIVAAEAIILLEAPELKYNGEKQEYEITIKSQDDEEIDNLVVDIKYYDVDNDQELTEAPTVPGNYKITVEVPAINSNHKATKVEQDFEIEKAQAKLEISKPELVYNGEKQEFDVKVFNVKDEEVVNAEVKIEYYKTSTQELLTEIPSLPGFYTVIIKVAAIDENYEETIEEIEYSIGKASANINIVEPSLIYDGSLKEFTVTAYDIANEEIDASNITIEYYNVNTNALLNEAPTNSGTYKVVVTVAAIDENYEETTKEQTFEIIKKVSNVSELTSAVENAIDGEIIVIESGTYNLDTLVIDKKITLRGVSITEVKLVFSDVNEIGLYIKNDATVENLTVEKADNTSVAIKAQSNSYVDENGVETLETLENVEIKDVNVSGGKTGINLHGIENAQLENVNIQNAEEISILFQSTNATIKDSTIESGTEGALKIEYTPFEEEMTQNDYPTESEVTLDSGNTINGEVSAEGISHGNQFVGEGWTENVDQNNDTATYTYQNN